MFAETKRFLNKFNIDVSSLFMSSLYAIVICQKYFRNRLKFIFLHRYLTRGVVLCVFCLKTTMGIRHQLSGHLSWQPMCSTSLWAMRTFNLPDFRTTCCFSFYRWINGKATAYHACTEYISTCISAVTSQSLLSTCNSIWRDIVMQFMCLYVRNPGVIEHFVNFFVAAFLCVNFPLL